LKPVRSSQDFFAGLMFAAIAAIVLYETWNLEFGSLARMGPGFFPVMLALVLFALAIAIIVRSVNGPERSVDLPIPRQAWIVTLATVLFGLLIGPLGFVPALVILVGVSSFADPDMTWLDTAKLAAGLSVGSVIIFVYLLKQPIALFGPYLPVL
jgi:putative tricarboxylic transport membrane protein